MRGHFKAVITSASCSQSFQLRSEVTGAPNGAASRGLAVRRSVLTQPLSDLMQISPRFYSKDKVACIRWLSIANPLQGFYPPVGCDGTGFELN